MKNQAKPCTEASVNEAIKEGKIEEILHCLLECFNKFKHFVFWKNTPEEVLEDTFWCAAFGLIRKRQRQEIVLTSNLCNYFRGFVANCLKRGSSKLPLDPVNELHEFKDEVQFTDLIEGCGEHLDAIDHCLEQLDEKCRKIIRSDLFGIFGDITDKKLAAEIGHGNWRGVSVTAKRCYDELWIHLETKYPGLFPRKLNRP